MDTKKRIGMMLALFALAAGTYKHHEPAKSAPIEPTPIVPSVNPLPVVPTFNPTALPELPECKPEQPKVDPPKQQPIPDPVPNQEPKPVAKTVVYHDDLTGVDVDGSAVIMLSTNNCRFCTQWWSEHADKLRAQGWQVREVKGVFPGIARYPAFRVMVRGRWYTERSFMTFDRLRELIKHENQSSMRRNSAQVVKTSTSWTINNQPWTRESLIDHLADHPNHGYSRRSLQAMTLEDLDRLHTNDHLQNN